MVNKHDSSAALPECQGTVRKVLGFLGLSLDMHTTNKTLRMYKCKPGRLPDLKIIGHRLFWRSKISFVMLSNFGNITILSEG